MILDRFLSFILATLEPSTARVLIRLPHGEVGLVRAVTSEHGEVIIDVTFDAREEMK